MFNLKNPTPLTLPNPHASNKSAAVQVKLSGLNQALRLGVMTQEEFETISRRLSLLVGSCWIDYDTQDHARHLTFVDYESKKCWELPCKDTAKEEKVWNDMFEYIYSEQRKKVMEEKRKLLNTVLNRLMLLGDNSTNTPFKSI